MKTANKKSIKPLIIFAISACLTLGWADSANLWGQDQLSKHLETAIERLAQQASYRWTTEVDLSESSRFSPGPTIGTTERDGITHVIQSFGQRSTHIVIAGEKAAVINRDGDWETVLLTDQGYGSEGFAASIARGVRTPVAEAKELASSLMELTQQGDSFAGRLPADVVSTLLRTRRDRGDIQNANGKVVFWISDGLLTRYLIELRGQLVREDRVRDISRQTVVEISETETAKPELPPGAEQALQRPAPKSPPRLSDAETARLFAIRGKRNVSVHDPSSIVQCGSEYWCFSTGNGVSSWRSNDLLTWRQGPRVLPDMPAWVTDIVPEQRGHFWAPDIIRMDNRYLLYYSVSSFGKKTSAIALVSNGTLDPDDPAYHWIDHGIVIQTGNANDFNAIDPAIIQTDSGEMWMSFGSFWSGIKLIQLDPKTGKRIDPDSPMYAIASAREIEAPHLFQHNGWYYLFVNWGKCCRGVDSTYNIRVGRSRQITGPYLDQEGKDLMQAGGTLLLGSDGPYIGPGHANVYRAADRFLLSCHYYDATERGRSMLSIQELFWSDEGWPMIGQR